MRGPLMCLSAILFLFCGGAAWFFFTRVPLGWVILGPVTCVFAFGFFVSFLQLMKED